MGPSASRRQELDFGPHEKPVRWLEEIDPAALERELPRKLGRGGPEAWLPWIQIGALAALRSTRFDGPRAPQSLAVLSAVRGLWAGRDAAACRDLLLYALTQVSREIHDPGFGPFRLLECAEVPGDGREGTLFSFLEAVRAGETDWADHRFAWLVRNLEKEAVIDLLLSSGLEGVARSADSIVLVVETVGLLQQIGWDAAPTLLRAVVRHQAWGHGVPPEYERCHALVADRDLHRLVRRRPPGQIAWGEREPESLLGESIRWAEADPEARVESIVRALGGEIPLEDVADQVSLSATLLFLQQVLSRREGPVREAEMENSARTVLGVLALTRLVRLGTPGQRILGLLLAGWVPPARNCRLETRNADRTWWLSPLASVREGSLREEEGPPAPEAWSAFIEQAQPNGLLPLLTERLEAGLDAGALEAPLVPLAAHLTGTPGYSVRLVRAFGEAYRGSRAPHRWLHLWAAGLALAHWPRS